MKIEKLREAQTNQTLVFETLGRPEKEREFSLSTIKKWGFDLVFGKKDGKETYFATESQSEGKVHSAADDGVEVQKLFETLPEKKKVFARIELAQGTAYLVVDLRDADENLEILRLPAGSILLAFLKKHKCWNVIEALRSLGSAAEMRKQKGQEGKPVSYDELPSFCKKFLKEAKKIEKETEFGRLSLAYFGENKDGGPRFQLMWLIPTISLFDLTLAEKIDKALEILD